MYNLSTKHKVKIGGYWPSSLFAFLWTQTKSRDLLYDISHLHVALCFFFCIWWFLLQNVFLKLSNTCFLCFHSCWSFWSSCFLVSSRQITHRKSVFCEENFHAPIWTLAKFYCRNKTGNPEQALSLHLAHSGSQSQSRIWFILPAHEASHIINTSY